MNNIKKLQLNSITSLINQVVVIISGLILPRYILLNFGSDTNGLTSSIMQFLSVIAFLELGVGAVVQSALYGPLARGDKSKINEILATARKFFRSIAKILATYVIVLIFIFPFLVDSPYDFFGTAFLIVSMSISSFAQYYFGIVNQLLLNADQKTYVHISPQILSVIVNTIVSVALISQGASIQVVKMMTGVIYLIRPLYLKYYVSKSYNVDYDIAMRKDSIPQMWNGIAQHVASVILNSTDMVVLTIFSTLENVSIYSVYNIVVNGVKLMITSLTSGIQSFFGNLLAKKQLKQLNDYFSNIEWVVHTAVVYVFGLTTVLINSFVMIYTKGGTDANYYVPLFSFLITIAQGIYCLRLPYNSMVLAGGHYKQTQTSAIIEASINLVISVLIVNRFGLVGVAIGTLCAMVYRTIYLAVYLSKNIIYRNIKMFSKHIIVDCIVFILMLFTGNIFDFQPANFLEWVYSAIISGITFFVITFTVNFIFYKEFVVKYIKKLTKK